MMTSLVGCTKKIWFLTLSLLSLGLSNAFVEPPNLLGSRQTTNSYETKPTTRPPFGPLYSSNLDDDELSKLIGKRKQIKRKKKEELPSEEQILEEIEESLLVDTSNLDFDSMPEFKTKRIARTPKQEEEAATQSKPAASKEPEITDYLADHDDENELHIPNRIGFTTRCWGEEKEGFVSSGKLKKQELREGKFVPGDLQVAYNKLLSEGVVLVETSPEYGKTMASKQLSAEHILARCIQEQENAISPLLVGTYCNKIWQLGPKALTSALSESCERMQVSGLEVYQVQNLGWLYRSSGVVKGLSEAVVDLGTVSYIGVQNISPLRIRRLKSKLEGQELTLSTNSFEFSLTNRKKEKWITACKALGVIPLIQNPLDGGLASGQFTASNPSGGIAGSARFSFSKLEKLQPLHSILESVAERVKTRLIREVKDVNERLRGRSGPTVRRLLHTASRLSSPVLIFFVFHVNCSRKLIQILPQPKLL